MLIVSNILIHCVYFFIQYFFYFYKGDLTPVSPMGKAFCSICALSGIIIIAMPIAIIGSNFVEFYNNRKKKELIYKMHNIEKVKKLNLPLF